MKKESKEKQCLEFMKNFDDPEAPDGAWQVMLEDSVEHFNESAGTNFDSYDMFIKYVESHN